MLPRFFPPFFFFFFFLNSQNRLVSAFEEKILGVAGGVQFAEMRLKSRGSFARFCDLVTSEEEGPACRANWTCAVNWHWRPLVGR